MNIKGTSNWLDLQRRLAWLAGGVEVKAVSTEDYLGYVRELLDYFEDMVIVKGG